jgi:hypothetical protein
MKKSFTRALYKIIQMEFIYRILFYLFLLKRKNITQNIKFTNNLKNQINEQINDLDSNGITKLKKIFNKDLLENINVKFTNLANNNIGNFQFNLHPDFKNTTDINSIKSYSEIKKFTNYISLKNPLMQLDELFILLNNEQLLSILECYFGCIPKLTYVNVRRSFVNTLTDMETNFYHCDENSYKFLKVFIYLNDVNLEGGPFTYALGSHKNKTLLYQSKYHYTDAEINNVYSKDKIFYATAELGDIILGNTRGFHKGTKVKNKERTMITLNFGVHADDFNFNNKLNYKNHHVEKLNSSSKLLFI